MARTALYLHPSDATRLLDEFAKAALPAVCAGQGYAGESDADLASRAYALALEMLRARQALLASGRLREVEGHPAAP